ncbi:hypothetical protein J5226_15850 [Lysobacter sp. K5869]|uniref:type IV secretion system protein n=1 Tax=Lysobacter sp. K5869 TaxID=2820808 RepID=UPI001C062197|nr:type IV secretion system protein [Lysobacter sp. K5869]QWP75103.1 hypothetical protein J5226_15850 [Lysobacter sp. K5869]
MKQTASSSFHTLAMAVALVVSAGVALAPAPAHAQWATEFTQGMNYAKLMQSAKTLSDQYTKLKDQLSTLQKQYDQLNPGNFNLGSITGFRDDNPEFKERGTNEGIEACEKGRSNVATQQLAICQKSVQISNLRFNAMVKMLKDVKTRDDEIQKLMKQREKLTGAQDKGKLDANTNDIARLQTQMENDIQNGKYTLDTYTAILNTLNDDMVATAKRALTNEGASQKGPFGLPAIGKVVQGVALKGALSVAGKRDL